MQAVQGIHAAVGFTLAHPLLVPETLAFLCVPDELALCWLLSGAERTGITAVPFHEPGLGGALTAVAVESAGRTLTRGYPLALPDRGGVKT